MLRTLFCTGALLALTIMHTAAQTPATPLPRVAVVCLDDNDRTMALADLVQLELGKSGKVDMVERAEFARVLAEQKLSAAGLTGGGAQVAVGKALRADALLLLERDRKAKVFRVRLTDTLYAAQLCRLTVANQDASTVEEASTLVSKAVLAALAKLAVPPAQRLLVTVVDFRNGTLSKDYAWVETEVPDLLETALIREPRVFVLDRERLGELLKEVQSTAGSDAAFSTGAILVDGDLMVKQGVALGNGAVPVILAVRLRDGDLHEIGRVQAEGTLDKARALLPPVQADLVKKIVALGAQKPVTVETEKRLLLEAASRKVTARMGTSGVAYAEAAHGLDPKDPQAVGDLLGALLGEPVGSSPAAAQKAIARLLRIQELLPLATPRDQDDACLWLVTNTSSILCTGYVAALTAEERAQLRPVREFIRTEAEKRFRDNPRWLVDGSRLFFEDSSACNDYVRALMERLLDPAQTPLAKRARAISSFFDAFADEGPFLYLEQPAEVREKVLSFLGQLTRHEDCVVRYFAARELADLAAVKRANLAPDPARQKEYATLALAALPDVLARDELFVNVVGQHLHPLREKWHGLREWAVSRGADPGDALARIARLYGEMLDKGDFARYARTSPERILADLPPQEAVRFIDQATALMVEIDRTHPVDVPAVPNSPFAAIPHWRWEFFGYVSAAVPLRKTLVNLSSPERAGADDPRRTVLLSSESPAWKTVSAEACRKWGHDPAKTDRFLPASRLLVDGDTAWVVFTAPAVLLVQVDLVTRQIRHTWIGTKTGDGPMPTVLCRWGDSMCVGTQNRGVWLCSLNNQGKQQETLIDAQTAGLLDPDVTALAAFGDDLYVGTKSGLWKYNRRSAVTQFVASSKAQGATRCLQPDTEVARLVTDSTASRLYIFSRPPFRVLDRRVYVHRWVPATSELTDLSPILMPKRQPGAANTALRGGFTDEPRNASVDPFKFYQRLNIFDPDTEKIVPERGAIPAGLKDVHWQENEVTLWRGDVLTMRAQFDESSQKFSWSLEQFSGLPVPKPARK